MLSNRKKVIMNVNCHGVPYRSYLLSSEGLEYEEKIVRGVNGRFWDKLDCAFLSKE